MSKSPSNVIVIFNDLDDNSHISILEFLYKTVNKIA